MTSKLDNLTGSGPLRALFTAVYQPDIDMAASRHNKMCARYYGPGQLPQNENSLEMGLWPAEKLWLFPPTSKLQEFLKKVIEQTQLDRAQTPEIFVLMPALTNTSNWHELVLPYAKQIDFLRGSVDLMNLEETTLVPPRTRVTMPMAVVHYGKYTGDPIKISTLDVRQTLQVKKRGRPARRRTGPWLQNPF